MACAGFSPATTIHEGGLHAQNYIFLGIIAALLIGVAKNPLLNAFKRQDPIVITDAGKPKMEVVKKGQKIEHHNSIGNIGQGEGAKAGTA